MIYFAALSSSYQAVHIALCSFTTASDMLAPSIMSTAIVDKQGASKELIPTLQAILAEKSLSLEDLTFIAANQGPAPFTTLRVVLSTLNGLNCAINMPLIGVDGLEAFIQEHHNDSTAYMPTVALLNAFNQDLYFKVTDGKGYEAQGCLNHQNLFTMIATDPQLVNVPHVRFIGNGAAMYRDALTATFDNRAWLPNPLPHEVSIQQIATIGIYLWQQKKGIVQQLMPLYLKEIKVI